MRRVLGVIMGAKFQDIGKRIDAALGNVDYDACRKLLAVEDLPEGEFLDRLKQSGTDLERLVITAIATTVIQSRAMNDMEEAAAKQRSLVDDASDNLTRLRKKLQREIDAAGVGATKAGVSDPEDPVARLKAMIAKPGIH